MKRSGQYVSPFFFSLVVVFSRYVSVNYFYSRRDTGLPFFFFSSVFVFLLIWLVSHPTGTAAALYLVQTHIQLPFLFLFLFGIGGIVRRIKNINKVIILQSDSVVGGGGSAVA